MNLDKMTKIQKLSSTLLLCPSRSLRITQSSRAPYGANIIVSSLSLIDFGSIPTKRRLSSSKNQNNLFHQKFSFLKLTRVLIAGNVKK